MDESIYYLQIDILKALAILSVIILHTVPSNMVKHPLSIFTIYQAVPIFFVLMATNALMSFKRHNYTTLSNIYPKYLKSRFKRVICPLIILWVLSLILGILLDKNIYLGALTVIGYLPLTGPGNYFISILLQFIILFPVLYKLYSYNPKYLLISSFILSFAFEIISFQVPILDNSFYWYKACILRYLFLIVLGMWLVDNFEPENLKSLIIKKPVLAGLILSTIYIIGVSIFLWEFPYFQSSWQPQTILSFFYPLILCAIGIRYLPSSSNRILNGFRLIGKASYHIFLIQILFFVSGLQLIFYNIGLYHNIAMVVSAIGNILILTALGMLFYYTEPKIYSIFNQGFSWAYKSYKNV